MRPAPCAERALPNVLSNHEERCLAAPGVPDGARVSVDGANVGLGFDTAAVDDLRREGVI